MESKIALFLNDQILYVFLNFFSSVRFFSGSNVTLTITTPHLGQHRTVLQAEVMAVEKTAAFLLDSKIEGRKIPDKL